MMLKSTDERQHHRKVDFANSATHGSAGSGLLGMRASLSINTPDSVPACPGLPDVTQELFQILVQD